MIDTYAWNDRRGVSRVNIEGFLGLQERLMDVRPASLPFAATTGRIVLVWLKAQLDAKPSDIEGLQDESGPVPVPAPIEAPPASEPTLVVRLTRDEALTLVALCEQELGCTERDRIDGWQHIQPAWDKLELAL